MRDGISVATGIIFVGLGIFLFLLDVGTWMLMVYGGVCVIIGLVILLTLREQESIEGIKKEIKRGKSKK